MKISCPMIAATILGVIGAACITQAGWIHLKAYLAQLLISAAWERAQTGEQDSRPWPWADTQPVARLFLGSDEQALIVLAGSSGRNLAFGPAHDPASVWPGERGNSVISGHRDTHFSVLRRLRQGDRLRVELPTGRTSWFVVTDLRVVDSRTTRIALDSDVPRLTLVTCYPFDAIEPGGPLRFVVTADWLASAGNVPPRLSAHAAGPLTQCSECVVPRQLAPDGELVDGLSTFVSDYAF